MSARKPKPKPEPNTTPAVIDANQLYTLEEAARRLRWRKHSRQQARRLGLKTVRFGSRDYCLGRDVLAFFDGLGEQQHAGDGDQTRERDSHD